LSILPIVGEYGFISGHALRRKKSLLTCTAGDYTLTVTGENAIRSQHSRSTALLSRLFTCCSWRCCGKWKLHASWLDKHHQQTDYDGQHVTADQPLS